MRAIDPTDEPLAAAYDPFVALKFGTRSQLRRIARRDAWLGDTKADAVAVAHERFQQGAAHPRRGVLVQQQRRLQRVGTQGRHCRLATADDFVDVEIVAHRQPAAADLLRMTERP
jgi:hypothetical protein